MNRTQAQRDWCAANACMAPENTHLVVGQTVEFNVTASSTRAGRNLSISVLGDPGLPNNCRITDAFTSVWDVATRANATTRRLMFTPMPRQEGLTYRVCVRAFDPQNSTQDFAEMCVHIAVAAPIPVFVAVSDEGDVTRTVGVGCPVQMRIVVRDASQAGYCMNVSLGKFDGTMGVPPLGALHMFGVAPQEKIGTHDGCASSEYHLLWYPQKGQEAQDYEFCIHAYDTLCMALACERRGLERCYKVNVAKCKYCLSAGETIMHAAARYQTDWLQIWGANTHIRNPDQIRAWDELTLGPTYVVQRGDTLEAISERFGTTTRSLMEANPDIEMHDNIGTIQPGDRLCVLPWVCWNEPQSVAPGTHTPNNRYFPGGGGLR
mmetsp:Transcript_27687/g.68444  ORF Transcript_27687/g.68444 Transcript_27687/m.68444 type:complete len:377 (-) Transcript_27687:1-1131(-)